MAKQLSFGEFEVALGQMQTVITTMKSLTGQIEDTMGRIGIEFDSSKDSWTSPSSLTFGEVTDWFKKSSKDLKDLLDDANGRLETAYQNYRDVEQTNLKNMH